MAADSAGAADANREPNSDFPSGSSDDPADMAFFGELRRLGYVEGGNLLIERYSAEGHHERYGIAREIYPQPGRDRHRNQSRRAYYV